MAKASKNNPTAGGAAYPYPQSKYAPPAPSNDPGQATHSDSARAVELIKTDPRVVYVNGPGPARQ